MSKETKSLKVNELFLSESATAESFPADANVRISITGLALCRLATDISEIKFLSHVPHHELFLAVIQKRRGSNVPILYHIAKIVLGQKISVKANNSTSFGSIEAPISPDEHHLSKMLNLPILHRKGLVPKNPPPPSPPIVLSISDCAFYTLETIKGFQIEDTANPGATDKEFGKILGGKIMCDNGSETEIKIEAAHEATLISELKLPERDSAAEFVYDIMFTNHCTNKPECEELMKDDSDFRFYYDLLKDPDTENRQFKLSKNPKGIEVGACVPAIEYPPVEG